MSQSCFESSDATIKKDLEIQLNKLKREKMELYIKLEQLTKDVLRLTKDKELNKTEIRSLTDSLQQTKKELTETHEKLNNCTKNYYELHEENSHLKATLDLYMNEKLFLFQELDIYKKQIEEYEKIRQEAAVLRPPIGAQEEENRKRTPSTSLKSLNKEVLLSQMNELNSSILKLENELKEKNSEIMLKTQLLKENSFEKEELLNELNYLKKKNQSLINEKILNHPQNFQQGDEKIQEKADNEILAQKPEILPLHIQKFEPKENANLEEELKKLKDKVKNQEITIET